MISAPTVFYRKQFDKLEFCKLPKADSLNWNASSCLDFRSFDFSNVKSLIVFLTFGSVEIQVTEFDPSTAEASDHALETLETVNGVPTDQWLAENNGG